MEVHGSHTVEAWLGELSSKTQHVRKQISKLHFHICSVHNLHHCNSLIASSFQRSEVNERKLVSSVRLFATPWTYTVHGILQARILDRVAFPFSRRSSNPGIIPRSPALQADSLSAEPQGKPKNTGMGSLSLLQWIFSTQESNWGLLCCRQIFFIKYLGLIFDLFLSLIYSIKKSY